MSDLSLLSLYTLSAIRSRSQRLELFCLIQYFRPFSTFKSTLLLTALTAHYTHYTTRLAWKTRSSLALWPLILNARNDYHKNIAAADLFSLTSSALHSTLQPRDHIKFNELLGIIISEGEKVEAAEEAEEAENKWESPSSSSIVSQAGSCDIIAGRPLWPVVRFVFRTSSAWSGSLTWPDIIPLFCQTFSFVSSFVRPLFPAPALLLVLIFFFFFFIYKVEEWEEQISTCSQISERTHSYRLPGSWALCVCCTLHVLRSNACVLECTASRAQLV